MTINLLSQLKPNKIHPELLSRANRKENTKPSPSVTDISLKCRAHHEPVGKYELILIIHKNYF